MDHAAAMPVSDLVFPGDLNKKIRTVGLYVDQTHLSCVAYNHNNAHVVLEHEHAYLLADISLLVDEGLLSLPTYSKLVCIGTLDRAHEDEIRSVDLTLDQAHRNYASWPMILRVIFAKVDDDLDLRLWASSARKIREAFPIKTGLRNGCVQIPNLLCYSPLGHHDERISSGS